ncbi:hypothetical protein LguiB_019971 [Lonicera macranthoides]
MASIISCNSPLFLHLYRNPISLLQFSSPSFLPFPLNFKASHHQSRFCALKSGLDGSSSQDRRYGSDLIRKPVVRPAPVNDPTRYSDYEEEFVDWEDQILEATVPLVGFVRMILHSDTYGSGERLSAKHERIILERLLPHHPECEKKIGSGVDYITVGYHPDFVSSRCLFIVRKDGELVDFSYWKCIKSFIKQNYPLYARAFILRHFRQHRNDLW